jgi:hypothetical protein
MSAPRRWVDSTDGSDEIRSLFAAGKPTLRISREDHARLNRRLTKRLAATALATSMVAWKSVAIAAVIGLAATTGAVVGARAILAARVPSTAPAIAHVSMGAPARAAVPSDVPSSAAASRANQSTPAPSTRADPPRGSVATPRAPSQNVPSSSASRGLGESAPETVTDVPGDTLAAELVLLDEARSHYAANPRQTLDILSEHARRFPDGKLVFERELLALDALKELGRTAEEQVRAERLLGLVRGTIYEQRVRTHVPGVP